jgi:vacuolar-type H+-ATPase subunit I/STV1
MAENETDPGAQAKGTDRFFSKEQVDEMLNKAREQERSKLYPTIESTDARAKALDEEVKALRKSVKSVEKIEADRLAAVEEARRIKEESELSAKEFAERIRAENAQAVANLQAQQETERALLRKELEFMQLQNHVQRRVAEEADNIAPELIDFIGGDTVEQVEASIEVVKAKSAQILANIQSARQHQRTQLPGVAPASGSTGITPLDQQADRQVSGADIKGMTMSEYAQLRQKIRMPNGGGRGLFD